MNAPRCLNSRMALFRRQSLIWLALLLAGTIGTARAASREERAYTAAVQAFNDHFYPVSETRFNQFLQNYRRSTNAPMATLLLAQSEFYLKKYSAVTNRLSNPVNLARAETAGLADQYIYWQAEALYANGDAGTAAQTFVSLVNKFPHSPLALSAAVEAAAAYGQTADWPQIDALLGDTNGLFQQQAAMDPGQPQVINGRLLQAQSKSVQRDFAAAAQVLKLINPATLTPEQEWTRAHLLYSAYVGMNDLGTALVTATNLLEIARRGQGDGWTTNLAESVMCHTTVLEKQGRYSDAAVALQEDLSTNIPSDDQQWAILKLADLALVQTNLTDAENLLTNFISNFREAPAAQVALLTLGELNLKDYLLHPGNTNDYLAVARSWLGEVSLPATNPVAGKVALALGWCDWLSGAYPESFTNFQNAAQLLPLSDDLAVARLKMGDAQFAQTNYDGAQTNYEAVLNEFTSLPGVTNALASQALYQILLARLAAGEMTGVEEPMNELLDRFSADEEAEQALFLAGEGFVGFAATDFNSPARARLLFQKFETLYPISHRLAHVAFAVGRTFERETNWQAAATNYQAWVQTYPTNELRPQVEYAWANALAHTGDDAAAFEKFTNFISFYPTDPVLTPRAYWWVAGRYFSLGGTNLIRAELNYQPIFQNFPTSELARPAQLMAARAEMGLFQYSSAIRLYLRPLLDDTNCPADMALKARFAYCEALRFTRSTNYDNLVTATNILLSQIVAAYPTNYPGALAWSETADCSYAMGDYDSATNAYAQAFSSPGATPDLVAYGRLGMGNALEKKAGDSPDDFKRPLLDQAMDNYVMAFDPESPVNDESLLKKAGLRILSLNAKTHTLQDEALNQFMAKMLKRFPQLQNSPEFKH